MSRGIIALITDFGTRDHYVAAMKGAILCINPEATLVDVSHDVPPGDVRHGSYLLAQTCPHFPRGTVHLTVVDPGVGGPRRAIAVRSGIGTFVGPDNGLFTPVYKGYDVDLIVRIEERRYFHEPVSATFHGRDIFAPVAAHLSLGSVDCRDLGPVIDDPVILEPRRLEVSDRLIRGNVVLCDRFGNVITDVPRDALVKFLNGAEMIAEIRGTKVNGLGETYGVVGEGEMLALIGSSGCLEVGVNGGSAAERIGARAGDEIVIQRLGGKRVMGEKSSGSGQDG